MKYCVYLTTYRGSQLPPFYIGYSLTKKVKNKNYQGSVSSKRWKAKWLQEKEHHPELFRTTIISLHETKLEANEKEIRLLNLLNAVTNPMYINQCAFPHFDSSGRKRPDLTERNRQNKGKKRPEISEGYKNRSDTSKKQHRENIRQARLKLYADGYINPMKGKKRPDFAAYLKSQKGTKRPDISARFKGKPNPQFSEIRKRTVTCVDIHGNCLMVPSEEFKSNPDLVGVNSNEAKRRRALKNLSLSEM